MGTTDNQQIFEETPSSHPVAEDYFQIIKSIQKRYKRIRQRKKFI